MKKTGEWIRKSKKRQIKKKDCGIVEWMMIVNHFFKELLQWINEMKDSRNLSYTIYTQADLIFMDLLKNACSVESMRQMEETFNEEECIHTLRILAGDNFVAQRFHRRDCGVATKKGYVEFLEFTHFAYIFDLMRLPESDVEKRFFTR